MICTHLQPTNTNIPYFVWLSVARCVVSAFHASFYKIESYNSISYLCCRLHSFISQCSWAVEWGLAVVFGTRIGGPTASIRSTHGIYAISVITHHTFISLCIRVLNSTHHIATLLDPHHNSPRIRRSAPTVTRYLCGFTALHLTCSLEP